MIGSTLALMMADKPEVDVSAHLELSTSLILATIGLLCAFFVIRPELWRRLFFQRIDPRPAAIMRIGFGFVVFWTFLDLLLPHGPLDDSVARFLFTDEGLWLTDMARKNYGGQSKTLWDPEHGFENWYDIFKAMWGKFSILHYRSDPTFVFSLYGAMMVSLTLMVFGVWTRWTTIISWILVETIYRYSPVFYTGGDTVVRVFLFMGMFTGWGHAYSFDSWRRRRKAILRGAKTIPPLPRIASWPFRIMMVQLAIIYCATGLLKSGATWADGSALYYALNLDHFYRWPQMGLVGALHYIGILPLSAIVVHWWEVFFPLAIVGAGLNAYEREKAAGVWPKAQAWRRFTSYAFLIGAWGIGVFIGGLSVHYFLPDKALEVMKMSRGNAVVLARVVGGLLPLVLIGLYLLTRRFLPRVNVFIRHYLLGKRFWLIFGTAMHLGIDAGMNVGTFANVMIAVYPSWLSGEEIDAFWRYVVSRPSAPGEDDRPVRNKAWKRLLLWLPDRLRYRSAREPIVVVHNPDEASVRRAALLRVWDLGKRLEFESDADATSEHLLLRVPGEKWTRAGKDAGWSLIRVIPGLWWMRGLRHVPGFSSVFSFIALRILRQR